MQRIVDNTADSDSDCWYANVWSCDKVQTQRDKKKNASFFKKTTKKNQEVWRFFYGIVPGIKSIQEYSFI